MKRQIVLDTETTGLDPIQGHRIIEIGCIELIDRRITDNYFHVFLNPERLIDKAATDIHGITNEFLQDKPRFSDIVDQLISYLDHAEIIIHNAAFDLSFLENEFKLINKAYRSVSQGWSIVDSLQIARSMHPGQKNSLDALKKRYEVKHLLREKHGALLDAKILAHIYLAMTGGQFSLFDYSSNMQVLNDANNANLKAVINDLLPIHVSQEDEYAHQSFIKFMENYCSRESILWKEKGD